MFKSGKQRGAFFAQLKSKQVGTPAPQVMGQMKELIPKQAAAPKDPTLSSPQKAIADLKPSFMKIKKLMNPNKF